MSKLGNKIPIITINSENISWQSPVDSGETSRSMSSTGDSHINDNGDAHLLDFMTDEEFLQLIKNKTDNNYNALWKVSKSLTVQLQALKTILSANAYVHAGKRDRIDILDKIVDSMKYTLRADFIYVYEHSTDQNTLRVTHSNTISSINQHVMVHETIEGIFIFWFFYYVY